MKFSYHFLMSTNALQYRMRQLDFEFYVFVDLFSFCRIFSHFLLHLWHEQTYYVAINQVCRKKFITHLTCTKRKACSLSIKLLPPANQVWGGVYPSLHFGEGCLPGGVCLGVSAQGLADTPPGPEADNPSQDQRQTPTHPDQRQTPPSGSQQADSMHPTGMHSCFS